MADKFILTGELQLRLGSTATVLKDLKTLSKDIVVGIDKAYFDKSVKYIYESVRNTKPEFKIGIDKTYFDKSIKYIYASLRNIKANINVGINKETFDKDIKYIYESARNTTPEISFTLNKTAFKESFKEIQDTVKERKFKVNTVLKLYDFANSKKEIREKLKDTTFKVKASFDFSKLDKDIKDAFKSIKVPDIDKLESFSEKVKAVGDPTNISQITQLGKAISSINIQKDIHVEIRKIGNALNSLSKVNDDKILRLQLIFDLLGSLKIPTGITNIGSLAANLTALSRVGKDYKKIENLTNALTPFLNLPFNNAQNISAMFTQINTNINSAILSKYTSTLRSFIKTATTGAPKISALANSFYQLRNALNGLASGNPQISFNGINTTAIKGSVAALSSLQAKNKQVAQGTAEVGSEMEMLGRQASATIRRFGAYTFATAVFFKLSGAIKSSLSEAIEFEKEVYKIVQVTKLSKITVGDLVKEVDRLSTSYGVSSSKILNSSLVIAQAGFSASETTKILESLAKTELAATFDDIENTVEGAIAAIQQFNLEASQMDSLLSTINSVSAQFAVESSDLTTAIRKAGSTFRSAGGDLNELFALFTSVRATTRESADTISTGFRTIFARLQRARTADFLKSLGVNIRYTAEEAKRLGKTEGDFVGAYEAIRRLSTALSSVSELDPRYSQIVEELGGFRQLNKVIPLIQNFETAEKALSVATKSSNSLTEDAAVAQESLANKLTKLREEFLKLIREVSNSDTFKFLIDGSLQLLNNINSLSKSLINLLPIISSVGAIKILTSGREFLKGFHPIHSKDDERSKRFGGFVPSAYKNSPSNKSINRTSGLIGIPLGLTFLSQFASLGEQASKTESVFSKLNKIVTTVAGSMLLFKLGLDVSKDTLNKRIDSNAERLAKGINLRNDYKSKIDLSKSNIDILDKKRQDLLRKRQSSFNYASADFMDFDNARNDPKTSKAKLDRLYKQHLRSARKHNNYITSTNADLSEISVDRKTQRQNINNFSSAIRVINPNIAALEKIDKQLAKTSGIMDKFSIGIIAATTSLSLLSEVFYESAETQRKQIEQGLGGRESFSRNVGLQKGTEYGANALMGGGLLIQLGLASGVLTGGLSIAIAGVIAGLGALTFGIYGYAKGIAQAEKELKRIDFSRVSENVARSLRDLDSIESTSNFTKFSFLSSTLKDLESKLGSTSDPDLTKDIKATIDTILVPLKSSINSLSSSGLSKEQIDSLISKDILQSLAYFGKETVSSLKSTIDSNVEIINKRTEAEKESVKSINEFNNSIKAVSTISSSLKILQGTISSISSDLQSFGSTGTTQVKPFFSGVESSEFRFISDFEQRTKNITSNFGQAGTILQSNLNSSKVLSDNLPSILRDVKNQVQLSADTSDISSTIKKSLEDLKGPDGRELINSTLRNVVLSKVQTIQKEDIKDSNFFRELSNGFQEVIDTLASSSDQFKEVLIKAEEALVSTVNDFSSGLASARKNLEEIRTVRSEGFSIQESFQDFLSNRPGSRTDFQALRNIQSGRDSLFRDPTTIDPNQIAKDRQEIDSLTEQISKNIGSQEQSKKAIERQESLRKGIDDSVNSLKYFSQALTRSTSLQKELDYLEQKRLNRNSLFKSVVFGSSEENRQFAESSQLLQLLEASNYNINTIPQDKRNQLSTFIDSFGEEFSNENLRKIMKNSFGIDIGPTNRENELKSQIELIYEQALKANANLNTILTNQNNTFITELGNKFDEIFSKLFSQTEKLFLKDTQDRISEKESEVSKIEGTKKSIEEIEGKFGIPYQQLKEVLPTIKELTSNLQKEGELRFDIEKIVPTNFKDLVEGAPYSLEKSLKTAEIIKNPSYLEDKGNEIASSIKDEELRNRFLKEFYTSILPKIKDEKNQYKFDDLSSLLKYLEEFQTSEVTSSRGRESIASSGLSSMKKAIPGIDFSKILQKILEDPKILEKLDLLPNTSSIQDLNKEIASLRDAIKLLKQPIDAAVNNNPPVVKKYFGGKIDGIGNTDKVHTKLTPGEYVVNKRSVSKYGLDLLEKINNGTLGENVQFLRSGGQVRADKARESAAKARKKRFEYLENNLPNFDINKTPQEHLKQGWIDANQRSYNKRKGLPINENIGVTPKVTKPKYFSNIPSNGKNKEERFARILNSDAYKNSAEYLEYGESEEGVKKFLKNGWKRANQESYDRRKKTSDVQPSYPYSGKKTLSDEEIIGKIPQHVRDQVSKYGVSITRADKVTDVLPELKNKEPRGQKGKSFENVPGVYSDRNKKIALNKDASSRVVLHEYGHAFSASKGGIQNTPEFLAAYERDSSKLSDEQRKKFSYLLKETNPDGGTSEAFASVFASVVNDKSSSSKHFPEITKLVKGMVYPKTNVNSPIAGMPPAPGVNVNAVSKGMPPAPGVNVNAVSKGMPPAPGVPPKEIPGMIFKDGKYSLSPEYQKQLQDEANKVNKNNYKPEVNTLPEIKDYQEYAKSKGFDYIDKNGKRIKGQKSSAPIKDIDPGNIIKNTEKKIQEDRDFRKRQEEIKYLGKKSEEDYRLDRLKDFSPNTAIGVGAKTLYDIDEYFGYHNRKVKAPGFNSGGVVPGSGSFDTVNAKLTPGEFVMKKNAVKKIGVQNLQKMNDGVQHFANGGQVQNGTPSMDFSGLNSAIKNFELQITRLEKSFSLIPSEINLVGKHSVEVIINGAQVLTSLIPQISEMIEKETQKSINKMLKTKFPDVGLM